MPALPSLQRPAAPLERGPRTPHLRVVGRPRHTARYVVVVLGLAVLGVIGVVSLSALAAEAAFEARELQSEVDELTLRYDELTADVAALESPERIRGFAEEELGMVPAESPSFLLLQRPGGPSAASERELTDRLKPVRGE